MSVIFKKTNYELDILSAQSVHELFESKISDSFNDYNNFIDKVRSIFTSMIDSAKSQVNKKKGMLYKEAKRKKDKRHAQRAANKLYKNLGIKSTETGQAYYYVYLVYQRFLNTHKLGVVIRTCVAFVVRFLNELSKIYNSNTLKKYKQALQWVLRNNGKLKMHETLEDINPGLDADYAPRFYTSAQFLTMYVRCKTPQQRASLAICYYSGLRAHEILTILPEDQREPHQRPALDTKFQYMNGRFYTVRGKGGLIRLVCIPHPYTDDLEALRLSIPEKVKDRGKFYYSHYAIIGGARLSSWFSQFSKEVLGFSNGVHGLRHSYAQNRFKVLLNRHLSVDIALRTVSQELGHFRPEITKVYLRGILSSMITTIVNKVSTMHFVI